MAGLCCVLIFFSLNLQAASSTPDLVNSAPESRLIPEVFSAEYEASYGGFKASAGRYLQHTDSGEIELSTSLKLKLLGRTISTITERSLLAIDKQMDQLKPLDYSYTQTGLGKRQRTILFDWDKGIALSNDGKEENEQAVTMPITDNLSAYLEITRQLQDGKQNINFQVLDKGELEEYQYRVLGEELISTVLGAINTVKLERVRDTDNNRRTEIWLALEWNFLLVKLRQEEKGSREIQLDLKQAKVNDTLVTGVH